MGERILKKVTGNLSCLAPDEWFSNRNESSIWLRIYTSLFIHPDKFISIVEDFVPGKDSFVTFFGADNKILLGFGYVEDLKVPYTTQMMWAGDSGNTEVHINVDNRELPKSNYIFLATPYITDGKKMSEGEVRKKLDFAAGIVCLHTGLNFMRDIFFEGEVRAKDGSFSTSGKPFRVPQICEGPYLAKQNGEDIYEIATRLSVALEPKKSRVNLAIYFLNSAMRKDEGFFEYWTALEVLCNGKANRIMSMLKDCYNLKNHKEAGEKTGFSIIADWRHKFMHKGIRPILSADIERYLQLLFIDLLRHELDLPFRGHIAAMQHAKGYDLSPIGLADNRTEEQKKAQNNTKVNGEENKEKY